MRFAVCTNQHLLVDTMVVVGVEVVTVGLDVRTRALG